MSRKHDLLHAILDFCVQAAYTIKYNLFYIAVSLLMPFILFKMQVGKELLEDLLVHQPVASALKTVSVFLGFSLLTFSLWTIPVLSVYIWAFFKGVKGKEEKEKMFEEMVKVYNGEGSLEKQWPMRYFSILPWAIFTVTCSIFFLGNLWWLVVVTLIILSVVLIDVYYEKSKLQEYLDKKAKDFFKNSHSKHCARRFAIRIIFISVVALALTFGGVLFTQVMGNDILQRAVVVLAAFLFTVGGYLYMVFMEDTRSIPATKKMCTPDAVQGGGEEIISIPFKVTKFIYCFCLILCISLVIFLYVKNRTNIMDVSPIFIILILVTFYCLIADLLITSQIILEKIAQKKDKEAEDEPAPRGRSYLKYGIYLAVGIYLFTLIFNSINDHRIRKDEVNLGNYYTDTIRPELFSYMGSWLQSPDRVIDPVDSSLTVYLVSGQGGGSRAAVWFYLNMKKLDSSRQFKSNLFSISTVSGSTSGAMMFLADRYFDGEKELWTIPEKAKRMYARNYISGSVFGMLLGDGVEGLISTNDDYDIDRNYYMQKEEMRCYSDARGIKTDMAKQFFENDYLSIYSNRRDSMNNYKKMPLFLINTAIINNGAKAVFSPVSFGEHIIGVDLYKQFKNHVNCLSDTKLYNIPLVTCVNQSQAFPLINSYNYVDCVGRLIDGGMFENSGSGTTLEVYEAFKKYLREGGDTLRNIKRIRFVCISIINGNISNEYDGSYKAASLLNSLSAAVNTPFGGHENFAVRKLQYKLNNNYDVDTAIHLLLDDKVTLTKMLPDTAVTKMNNRSDSVINKLRNTVIPFPKRPG